MKRIYKYVLPLQDMALREMPKGAQILSVEEQAGEIVAYALIDDTAELYEPHRFRIVGTGHPCDDLFMMRFLGTVKMAGGRLMFHVFHDPMYTAAASLEGLQ